MKRIFIFVTVALAFAGCSQDTLSETEGGNTYGIVAFSTASVTRGTPMEDASLLTDIGTFGYYTGQSNWTAEDLPNRMFNRRLYRDGSEWKYDGTPVQWNGKAAGDRFTFYAYAPYATGDNGITVNGNASTGGIPTLTYTVPGDVTKQPDLMVAVPRMDIVKPASGYVSLNMKHALTTIGFQVSGSGERITGLSISGVSMTGTLAMNGGNIEWTGLDTSPAADFSASINVGDEGYYTATPTMSTDLMKGDGYLMMIPQMLGDDAALVVSYADGTSIDINIEPHEWLPGKRIIYELTLVQGGAIVVEPSEITMPYIASRREIVVDCSDGLGRPNPSLAWTLSTNQTWLTLSLDSNGTNAGRTLSGTGTQTVYLFATLNSRRSDRTSVITLNGEENVVTTVIQHYSAAQRFARSNIVMHIDGSGNKILTFAETQADHTAPKSVTYYDASTASTVTGTVPAIAANVQGLHFRWGSLVGITSNGSSGTAFEQSHVVFWPSEYTPPGSWVFNNNGAYTDRQVPYIGGAEIGTGGNQYAFEGYPNGTGPGYDKAGAKGDICRYISNMGWVKGRWRMPTTGEIRELLDETMPFYGYDGKIIGMWNQGIPNISNTGANGSYGYYRIPNVRVVGKGVTGSENSTNSLTNPGAAKVVFPASGYRGPSDGRLYAIGNYGLHWSATPSAAEFAYNLDYHDYTNHPANSFGRANGYSVRCIME